MVAKRVRNTKMLTIMFVDIVDYTRTTNKLDREQFLKLHDIFDNYVKQTIKSFKGKIIKKIGDAFLITFQGPTDGVLCAIEMQKKFIERNQDKTIMPIEIRIALHGGEVLMRDGDVYGDTVNMAARIESVAKPNDIVFSQAVFDSINKKEIPIKHLGMFKLKGARISMRLFKVKTKQDVRNEKKARAKKQRKNAVKRFFGTMIFLFSIAIIISLAYIFLM